jgi:hypothetical protein
VLQLLVLGYTPTQIATLLALEEREVLDAAATSTARMGAAEWSQAAAALVRRGVLSAR